jgi:dimethylglycine dehydrogenase
VKSHAQVAVIGGGVVGCSVLYHLAKAGWQDLVLLERDELTCGSTWHAAGGMHTLNSDPNVAKLQDYTIRLYKEIEELSGQSCGVHITGGVLLAGTPERMDWLKAAVARSRYLGMELELISSTEALEVFPLLDPARFVGALYDPMEGHVDPAGVTHAYAKSAQLKGAEIHRKTPVVGLRPRPDGSWDVVTPAGTIVAEHVVNAGGLWAREVGRLVGLELPVLAMEHHYLFTDDIPELVAHLEAGKTVGHAIDFEGELYLRQERHGVLLGTYEQAATPWAPKVTPADFSNELLAPDLDRIAPSLEVGFKHFPAIERAGIRRIVNGPFTFAPDGNPLVGPVRGLRNFWCACGVMAGFSQGGGVGLALANWMIEGDPGFDVFAMDLARFGDWATRGYTNAKVRENYSRRFRITFPNEELPAGRPLRTTPVYDRLKAENAVFGAAFGLEYPLWFAPAGAAPVEQPTFRRSNAHAQVGAECKAVRSAVGLIETSGYAKYEVAGPGAEAWLAQLLTNRMPQPGRLVLAPMLNRQGRLIGDFTVAHTGPERFLVFGSGMAEQYHLRWFEAHLPADGRVRLRPLTAELLGFAIAGPSARTLLARLTDEDVGPDAFRFRDVRALELGAVPATVVRLSFTGDLGYELWVRADHQLALYERLRAAGEDLGLALVGARAVNSLRLEKGYGTWAREYRPIYGPHEAGLDGFVAWDKGEFIGREAALAAREAGPTRKLVTFVVDDAGVDVMGDEPVWQDDRVVGWVTSGGYAHHVGRSVALGYVPPAALQAGEGFAIEILGERRPARLALAPLFDPEGTRIRA